MKFLMIMTALFLIISGSGCSSLTKNAVQSAARKNLTLDGSVIYGVAETFSNETAAPQGKMIIGRLSYKSRIVAIPSDQKIPVTGYYKSTRTKSLFGTEEEIVEYDFTASDTKSAPGILERIHLNIK